MFWNSARMRFHCPNGVVVLKIPSPRWGLWWAKPSTNKPPSSPIWRTKYYKSVEFVKL